MTLIIDGKYRAKVEQQTDSEVWVAYMLSELPPIEVTAIMSHDEFNRRRSYGRTPEPEQPKLI